MGRWFLFFTLNAGVVLCAVNNFWPEPRDVGTAIMITSLVFLECMVATLCGGMLGAWWEMRKEEKR